MLKVESKTIQRKLTYNGTVILKYRITYPQVRGFDKFNMHNYKEAISLQNRCENELFEEAKKTYDYNKENGYPIMVYEVVLDFLVTYNYNNFISLYSDEYTFSGRSTRKYNKNITNLECTGKANDRFKRII